MRPRISIRGCVPWKEGPSVTRQFLNTIFKFFISFFKLLTSLCHICSFFISPNVSSYVFMSFHITLFLCMSVHVCSCQNAFFKLFSSFLKLRASLCHNLFVLISLQVSPCLFMSLHISSLLFKSLDASLCVLYLNILHLKRTHLFDIIGATMLEIASKFRTFLLVHSHLLACYMLYLFARHRGKNDVFWKKWSVYSLLFLCIFFETLFDYIEKKKNLNSVPK